MISFLLLVKVFLAVVFLFVGCTKLAYPIHLLAQRMNFVRDLPEWIVRGIGLLEVLGAVGLFVPDWVGWWRGWVSLAALGLAFIMVGAGATHLLRKEYPMIFINAVLFGMAVFVAFMESEGLLASLLS